MIQRTRPRVKRSTLVRVVAITAAFMTVTVGLFFFGQGFIQLSSDDIDNRSDQHLHESVMPSVSPSLRINVDGLVNISPQMWNSWTAKWHDDHTVNTMRAELLSHAWIREARVVRRNRGEILVLITENELSALQYEGNKTYMVFVDGRREEVSSLDKVSPSLPRVFGKIEMEDAADISFLLKFLPSEFGNIQQLERINNRRWDIVTTEQIRIKLPEFDWKKRAADLQTLVDAGLLTLHRHNAIHELDLRAHKIAIIKEISTNSNRRTQVSASICDGCEG